MLKDKHFADSIEILRSNIKNLVYMIIAQYNEVISALNSANIDLAHEVINNDADINRLSEEIDLDTVSLIAKIHLPFPELRYVVTINKLAYELERIADYAKNIAGYVIAGKKMNVEKAREYIASFNDMFTVILKMLEINLQAFLQEDKCRARTALLLDNEIDVMYQKNFGDLLSKIKDTVDDSEKQMISHALILNKQIERAGDHLTNISEQILYLVKGK